MIQNDNGRFGVYIDGILYYTAMTYNEAFQWLRANLTKFGG